MIQSNSIQGLNQTSCFFSGGGAPRTPPCGTILVRMAHLTDALDAWLFQPYSTHRMAPCKRRQAACSVAGIKLGFSRFTLTASPVSELST